MDIERNRRKEIVIDLKSWREWKAQKEQQQKRSGNVLMFPTKKQEVKICLKCDEKVKVSARKCSNCGFSFKVRDSEIIDSFFKNEE